MTKVSTDVVTWQHRAINRTIIGVCMLYRQRCYDVLCIQYKERGYRRERRKAATDLKNEGEITLT